MVFVVCAVAILLVCPPRLPLKRDTGDCKVKTVMRLTRTMLHQCISFIGASRNWANAVRDFKQWEEVWERETVSDWFGQIDYSAHWVILVNTLNRVPFNAVDVVAAKIPCHVSRGRLGHSHLNDVLLCVLLFFHTIYWRALAPKVKKKKLRLGIDLTLCIKSIIELNMFITTNRSHWAAIK